MTAVRTDYAGIAAYARQHPDATNDDLAGRFDCSRRTINRAFGATLTPNERAERERHLQRIGSTVGRKDKGVTMQNQLTTGEAAHLLGCTSATVRQSITRGALTATRHGRDWLLTRAEVERYARDKRTWKARGPEILN